MNEIFQQNWNFSMHSATSLPVSPLADASTELAKFSREALWGNRTLYETRRTTSWVGHAQMNKMKFCLMRKMRIIIKDSFDVHWT